MKDAFRAIKDLEGRHVLLIDDVCTTGATAQECAKALREAGAAKVTLPVYADAHRDARRLRNRFLLFTDYIHRYTGSEVDFSQ